MEILLKNWDQEFQTLNTTSSQKKETKICFIYNLGSYLLELVYYNNKVKKLCKSGQRELDAACHTFSVMHMPHGDLIEGNGYSNDKKI